MNKNNYVKSKRILQLGDLVTGTTKITDSLGLLKW
jgi:hypothetical protein